MLLPPLLLCDAEVATATAPTTTTITRKGRQAGTASELTKQPLTYIHKPQSQERIPSTRAFCYLLSGKTESVAGAGGASKGGGSGGSAGVAG